MSIIAEKPTLFVVARKNELLEKYGENLRIKDASHNIIKTKVPVLGIRDVVVVGDVILKSEIISLLEKHKVPIHFLSKGGDFKATMQFDFSKNIFIRKSQFEAFLGNVRLDLALEFVSKKISNQKMLLRKMRQKSVEFPKLDLIENLETLRGKEGAASKLYFSHWKRSDFLKNQNFKFKGRVKRPATDQINTLLSFSYSLLYSEIHTQIMIAGLDPYIGFLHDQNYGHSALASDVIEPFRALVDWFVLRIVNRKEIDAELDFELMDGGECKLSRSGYEKFFPKWSDFLRKELIQENRNLTQLIERDVRKLANFLMKDSDSFKAFVWKI